MIEEIQTPGRLPDSCKAADGACSRAMEVPYLCFTTDFTIYVLYALLLFADSWLAYKTALVTGIGIYLLAFL